MFCLAGDPTVRHQLHLSIDADCLQGNMVELSTDLGARGEGPEEKPQRTTFNPALQFGVPPRDPPTFRMTMGLTEVTVRCAQHPRTA